jgi:hypothetical protein
MQAVRLVNDHTSDCFRRTAVQYDGEEVATLRVSASRPPPRMNASMIAASKNAGSAATSATVDVSA